MIASLAACCLLSALPVTWNPADLAEVPESYPTGYYADETTNGIHTVYLKGLPFKGQETRVFAYWGVPASASATRKVPAMVLVHGGGGSAFHRWVKFWVDRGYAAISMDLNGCVSGNVFGGEQTGHQRHAWAGPGAAGCGGFDLLDEKDEDQWMYHAVAAVARSHSFLRAQTGVDPDRIGLTGVSWGGVVNCVAAAVDGRFRFAAPVYGCGFLYEEYSSWAQRDGGLSNANVKLRREKWVPKWDPMNYLAEAKIPVHWLDGTNDQNFSLPSLEESFRLVPTEKSLAVKVRLSHGHGAVSEQAPEVVATADRYLAGGAERPQLGPTALSGTTVSAPLTVDPRLPVVAAKLDYTTDDKFHWYSNVWQTVDAQVANGAVTATVPDGATYYYLSVDTAEGGRVSGALQSRNPLPPAPILSYERGATVETDGSELFAGAVYRLDASATNSLTLETGVNLEGETVTNVLRWTDARGAGDLYAQSTLFGSVDGRVAGKNVEPWPANPYPSFVHAHPTLTEVAMRPGVRRPAINFGRRTNTAVAHSVSNAATMSFSKVVDNLRDSFTVYADRPEGAGEILGNETSGLGNSHYMRSGRTTMLHTTYAAAQVQEGYIAVDGERKTPTSSLGTGWHVVSFGPTAATRVDSLMAERNCNAGGGLVAEQVAFSRPLAPVERAFVETYLMHKWLGVGTAPALTNHFDALRVDAGKRFSASEPLYLESLAGGGSVACPAVTLTESAELSLGCASDGSGYELKVDGSVHFAGPVTVRVTASSPRRVAAGETTLLTAAGGITGFDPSRVTLETNLPDTWLVSLVRRGNSLCLKVEKLDVEFESAGFRLVLDQSGKLKAFTETGTGRELAKAGLPWCRLLNPDGAESAPVALEWDDEGRLTFEFDNGGRVVERVEAAPWGLKFTIEACTLPDGWNVRPAYLVPTGALAKYVGALANALSDDESAIFLRSFDYDLQMTVSSARINLEMQAGRSAVGRRFGLAAGPRDGILAKMRQMVLDSGVAHSKAGGPWAMASDVARKSYLFGSRLGLGQMDAAIAASKRAGLGIVHFDGWYSSLGHYAVNTELFPDGMKDLKAAADKVRAAGMYPSIHCLTGCISFRDPWVVPDASADLLGVYTYTLAEPMTATSTEVVVNEMPDPRQTCLVTTYSSDGSALEIDGEIIIYSGIRRTKPYAFTGITRGKQVPTTPRSHAKGATVRYLRQRYNAFYPDPDSPLMEQLADNVASVYNAIGSLGIYFDGSEGFNNAYATAKMGALIANRLDRSKGEPHIEMSSVPAHYWPLRSTYYAWDEVRYGIKAGVDAHMKSNLSGGPKANFLPMQMGWWGPLVATEKYRSCFPDEYEYFAAKSAGNDAATALEYIDLSQGFPPVLQERALTVLGWYERFRLARAFTDEVNAELATLGKEGRLRQDETGRWTYTPVTVHRNRVVASGAGTRWTVDSPRATTADLRVEALYAMEGLLASGATQLFNSNLVTTAVSGGHVVANAKNTVSLSVTGAGSNFSYGGQLVELTATSRQDSPSGAWVGVERSFDAPNYLDFGSAIGVGFYVKGDGSGALLNVSLHQASEYGGVWADNVIKLDFTDWQYVQLLFRERDVDEIRNHTWPHSISTGEYMTQLNSDCIDKAQLLINEVPANGTVAIQLGPVILLKAQKTPQVLSSVKVNVNGTDFAVPFNLPSGSWAELTDATWSLYDEKGVLRGRTPAAAALALKAGENSFAYSAKKNISGGAVRAEIKVFEKGASVPALKPLTDEQKYALKWEPEMPAEWVPSNNVTALPPVRVRPGESANLEVTLRGPVADPVLKVKTSAGTETWPLETVAAGKSKTFTGGPLVSGVAEVTLESSAPGKADALVEFAKRYRVKGDDVRVWNGGVTGDWADVANWTMADGTPAESAPLARDLTAQFTGLQDVTVRVPRDLAGDLPLAHLVKTGEGRVNVEIVDNGLPPPVYRFDASATDTVQTVLSANGVGSMRTNVVRWLDADGNGCSARPPTPFSVPGEKNGALVSTNPTPVTVEMRPGVWRPAIDFGPYSGYYTNTQVSGTAGFNIHNPQGTAVAAALCRVWDTFAVWSDRSTTGSCCFIFTDSSKYHYHRSGRQILCSNDGPQAGTKDGYHSVDGVEVPWNYVLPAGFHVVSFSPTNATAVNRIAWDRTSNAGAALVGEMICFTNVLPAVRRRNLELALMNKWFGTPGPVWTNAVERLAVGPGCEIALSSDSVYKVDALAGAGSLTGGALIGIRELAPTGCLAVDGTLAFADAVTVDLSGYPGVERPGEYPLVTATDFANLSLGRWQVVSDFGLSTRFTLIERNGTIYVRSKSIGTRLIVQ